MTPYWWEGLGLGQGWQFGEGHSTRIRHNSGKQTREKLRERRYVISEVLCWEQGNAEGILLSGRERKGQQALAMKGRPFQPPVLLAFLIHFTSSLSTVAWYNVKGFLPLFFLFFSFVHFLLQFKVYLDIRLKQ